MMQKMKLLMVMLVLATAAMVQAATPEEMIAERIKRVGEVCIKGESCDEPMVATGDTAAITVAGAGSAAQAKYDKSCATCHAAGVAGAPMLGDKNAWEPRLAKGMDVLYANAINGLAPAMPAKGMCFDCTDDDLKAIVDLMLGTVQ